MTSLWVGKSADLEVRWVLQAPSLKSDSTGRGARMRAVESAWHKRVDTSGRVGSADKDYFAQGLPREMRI
ncbi:hypothetical protein ACLB2K_031806 [Fragaria x ananassa]